jgi:CPA2 family monovalent cation:H+ antiporter-2
VLAGGLALSSTSIVLQGLIERRELGTRPGRAAFAVLLFQDLAVVPLLTLIPLVRSPHASILAASGLALLKAGLVFLVILVVGRLLVRPLLRVVAQGRDPELFTAIVLLLVLGIGWLTEQAGLSMALGAFLAGVLVAETEYRPQVEADIQPFRGILLALFFITVGMGIDLSVLVHDAALLIALLGGLLLIKASLLFGAARVFRLGLSTAAGLSLMLAQGSEFGFVLFALARQAGVIPEDLGQRAVLIVSLSMALTPLLLAAGRKVAHRLEYATTTQRSLADDAREARDHVLIAGFGRVGQTMALLLEARGAPYIALDLDPDRVAEARRRGLPVYYGDASRADVLKAAGLENARLVMITVDEPDSARRTIDVVRRWDPELPIIARARDLVQCRELAAAGASAVVPELVEGSLQLAAELLRQLGSSQEEVDQLVAGIRREAYGPLAPLAQELSPPASKPNGG